MRFEEKPKKRAGETREYWMDFSKFPELDDDGDTLATIVSVTADPAGPTLSGTAINTTGVDVTIAGGTAGTTYDIIFTVTTSGGSTLVARGQLQVIA